MSVKRLITEKDGIFFITITCYNWYSLFEIGDAYQVVYNWFDHLKLKGHYITGYVIMPNHLHALISFSNTTKSINAVVGNGKRFMAYDIISILEKQGNKHLLNQLSEGVNKSDKKRGKLHEVFTDSFDIKECFSIKFITQKLNYIHWNPCTGKWMLADCPENYIHSSARFYDTGLQGIYAVENIMDLMDIDLSSGF